MSAEVAVALTRGQPPARVRVGCVAQRGAVGAPALGGLDHRAGLLGPGDRTCHGHPGSRTRRTPGSA
ncbi:hypothetical protein [Streptomyces coeruleorubidus]|uniref:hypothetical protein n=1 Tax=Streptomyces coeruleorubidus TaxID=116188 RepID=UPI00123DC66A|nr:hypothetical protein [Streptomyces coeruleorubidus]